MSYIGDFISAANISRKFSTRDFSTGAPFNTANANVAVYKDGNATAFNTGVTFTQAYNNRTGMHEIVVDTSNTTRYTSGNEYDVVFLQGTTVNSVDVGNEVIISFSIENRGVKQVSGNVGNVTGNIGGNLAGSAGSVTGNVGNVTSNIGGSLAGSVGSIAANGINESSFNQNAGSFYPLGIIDQGTASNIALNNIQFRAGLALGNNVPIGSYVTITSAGNGVAQTRTIKAFNNANRVAEVDSWAITPTNTVLYQITVGDAVTTNNIIGRLNSNVVANSVVGNVGNVTGNIGGSVAGSVGSVTGNVGNVTGNIGGSLAGSVGSVTGNVTVGAIANNAITAVVFNSNSITGRSVANDVDIRNVNGNVSGNVAGSVGSVTAAVNAAVISMSANSLKQFFNVNSTTNYASSVDGSVVKEIADNAGGSSLTADAILARLNSNLALGNQSFTLTGSVTGNVGNVTGDVGGNVAGSVGSVSGSVGSVVSNVNTQFVANNGIFAASFNANAVTGRVVANDVDIRNVNGNVAGNVVGTVASVTGNVGAVTGNVGGNLAGSVGSVTGNVGNVTGNLGGTVASVINLNAQLVDAAISTRATPAQVKTQVVAALSSDTYGEPGQGTPAATLDLATKLGYLYKAWRNKTTQTNNTLSLFADDGTTVDQKATVSDVNNVYTRGEIASGP